LAGGLEEVLGVVLKGSATLLASLADKRASLPAASRTAAANPRVKLLAKVAGEGAAVRVGMGKLRCASM
jgi:hypothetical protein